MSKNSFAIGRTMLCLLLVALAVSAFAAVGSVSDGADNVVFDDGTLKYEAVNEDSVKVVSPMDAKIERAYIPYSVTDGYSGKSYTVVAIADGAFRNCGSLVSVSMNTGIETIGREAFSGCKKLSDVGIPDSVKTIGNSAFAGTGIKYVRMDGVTAIGEKAFYGCAQLTDVGIPGTAASVGANAFAGCRKLAYVNVGEGVAVICESMFENSGTDCRIDLPSTVKTVAARAFSGYKGYLTLNEGLESVGDSAFASSAIKELTVPGSLKYVGKDATYKGTFESVTFSGGEDSAIIMSFSGCASLKYVKIGDGIKSICADAFSKTSVASVTIPGSVRNIGASVFSGCKNLTSVTVMDGVTQISDNMFAGTALYDVSLPFSVWYLGNNAFGDCAKLESFKAHNVVEVGEGAFKNCSVLSTVELSEGIMKIGNIAFSGCEYLRSFAIPYTVTKVGSGAFAGCVDLLEIKVESNAKGIDSNAFPGHKFYTADWKAVAVGDGDFTGHVYSGASAANMMQREAEHSVTYDLNGGTGPAPEVEDKVAEGSLIAAAAYSGTKGQSQFRCWYYNGQEYKPGQQIRIGTEDAVITAKWNESHAVSYDTAGGSGAAPVQGPVVEGKSFRVADYKGTRSGYVFMGWSCGDKVYYPGDSATMGSEDMVFRAIWLEKEKVHSVTFDTAGGSYTPPSMLVEDGTPIVLEHYDGTKNGYTFKGWSCNGEIYADGATVICKSDMKFTAVWEKNPGASWIDTNWPIVLVVSILAAVVLLCVAYLVYHRVKSR